MDVPHARKRQRITSQLILNNFFMLTPPFIGCFVWISLEMRLSIVHPEIGKFVQDRDTQKN
jgi:hypothetical protein